LKLFIAVIIASAVIGGFIGGELTGDTFTITGAAIGGVGLTVVLLSLGAFFSYREDRKRDKQLPPEMRGVFDRMVSKSNTEKKQLNVKDIAATMNDLLDQDREAVERGEVPERRLIPHHAIKRDVIILAYTKDFNKAILQIKNMDWTDLEKERRKTEEDKKLQKHINNVKRMHQDDLEKVIILMKETRIDFSELETTIRSEKGIYKIVDPL
jgi:hypothetical protein